MHAGIQRRALGTARRKEQRVAPQERPDRLLRLPGRQLIRQQLRHHGRAARRGMQVASQARADRVQPGLHQQAAVKFDLDLRVGHAAARDLLGDIAVAGAVQRKMAQKTIEIRRFGAGNSSAASFSPAGRKKAAPLCLCIRWPRRLTRPSSGWSKNRISGPCSPMENRFCSGQSSDCISCGSAASTSLPKQKCA